MHHNVFRYRIDGFNFNFVHIFIDDATAFWHVLIWCRIKLMGRAIGK